MEDIDWACVHNSNFKCTIETQLRSFYFKFFHRAICLNYFLHKIGRIESPSCFFCNELPETIPHLFCDCKIVSPLWDELCFYINCATNESFIFSKFDKMFGIRDTSEHDMCINFLFLCLKFYIHRCRFQQTNPNFNAFINFVKIKQKTEYKIAENKDKLTLHYKKWTFDLEAS